jgi:hypothetical protein
MHRWRGLEVNYSWNDYIRERNDFKKCLDILGKIHSSTEANRPLFLTSSASRLGFIWVAQVAKEATVSLSSVSVSKETEWVNLEGSEWMLELLMSTVEDGGGMWSITISPRKDPPERVKERTTSALLRSTSFIIALQYNTVTVWVTLHKQNNIGSQCDRQ